MESFRNDYAKDSGFTLVELLIVTALIAILVAIAIPQFTSYRTKSSNASAQSDLKNVKTAMEAFLADKGSYPASLSGI